MQARDMQLSWVALNLAKKNARWTRAFFLSWSVD
jgi:hypothetical protein